jgi:hypothetical protein
MGLLIRSLGLKSASTSICSNIECCVKCKHAFILLASLKGWNVQNNLSTSSLSRWTIKYIGKTQLTTHTTSSSSINSCRISISSILLTFWLDYSTCFAEIVSNTSKMSCSFDKLLRIFRRKKKHNTWDHHNQIWLHKNGFVTQIPGRLPFPAWCRDTGSIQRRSRSTRRKIQVPLMCHFRWTHK